MQPCAPPPLPKLMVFPTPMMGELIYHNVGIVTVTANESGASISIYFMWTIYAFCSNQHLAASWYIRYSPADSAVTANVSTVLLIVCLQMPSYSTAVYTGYYSIKFYNTYNTYNLHHRH